MQISTTSAASSQSITSLSDSLSRLGGSTVTGASVAAGGVAANTITSNQTEQSSNTTSRTQGNVQQAVEKINEAIKSMGASSNLEFSMDDETETVVVRVVDKQTNEVIRQIPSEEVLQIAKALDKLQGLLVQEKV